MKKFVFNKVTKEAENSYKNCADSAENHVFTHRSADHSNVCDLLENFFAGCKSQLKALADCKGQEHVDKISGLRLASTANILDTVLRNAAIKAKDCPILRKATTTTTTTTTTSTRRPRRRDEPGSQEGYTGSQPNIWPNFRLLSVLSLVAAILAL